MPALFNADGSVSNIGIATDTQSMQAGNPSFWDSVGEATTKGLPAVGVSIANSIYNLPTAIGNVFGNNAPYAQTADWFESQNMKNYINKNSDAIEGAGLFAGSFIPGGLAVKALKGFSKVAEVARAGEMTSTLSNGTGLFQSVARAKMLEVGIADVAAGDAATIPSLMKDYTWNLVGMNVADALKEGAVFNLAATAGMYASPLLRDKDFSDLSSDFLWGTAGYGVIAGGLESVWTRGLLKKAASEQDARLAPAMARNRINGLQVDPADQLTAVVKGYLDRADNVSPVNTGVRTEIARSNQADMQEMVRLFQDTKIISSAAEGEDKVRLANQLVRTLVVEPKAAGTASEDILKLFPYQMRMGEIDYPGTGVFSNDGIKTIYKTGVSLGSKIVDTEGNETGSIATIQHVFSEHYDPESYAGGPLEGYRFQDNYFTTGLSTEFPNAKEAFDAGKDVYIGKSGIPIINKASPNVEVVSVPGLSQPVNAKQAKLWKQGRFNNQDATKFGSANKRLGPARSAIRGDRELGYGNEPIVVRTSDGSIIPARNASPVIGDYGAPNVTRDGDVIRVMAGKNDFRFSLNETDRELYNNPNSNTVLASARNLAISRTYQSLKDWRAGDMVDPKDWTGLEALYNTIKNEVERTRSLQTPLTWEGAAEKLNTMGVSIGGEKLPTTSGELEGAIKVLKDELIQKMPASGDAEKNRIIAGVGRDYLDNATTAGNFFSSPEDFAKINNLKIDYNLTRFPKGAEGLQQGMLDHAYQISLAQKKAQQVAAGYFGSREATEAATAGKTLADGTFKRLSIYDFSSGYLNSTKQGLITTASAAYDSANQIFERIGRTFHAVVRDRVSTIQVELATAKHELDNAPEAQKAIMLYKAVLARSNESFRKLPPELQAQHFPELKNGESVRVLRDSLQKVTDPETKKTSVVFDKSFVPENGKFQINPGAGITPTEQRLFNYYILPREATTFLDKSNAINDARLLHENKIVNARNLKNRSIEPGNDYFPPIDVRNHPHFLYVKYPAGTVGVDDGVSMIVAHDADSLMQKKSAMQALNENLEFYSKDDIAKFKQSRGEYEHKRLFQETSLNSLMKNNGILNDFIPNLNYETFLKNQADWHMQKEMGLARNMIELQNSQLMAEMRELKESVVSMASSQRNSAKSGLAARSVDSAYSRAVNMMMGISPGEFYKPFQDLNSAVEAFGNTAFKNFKLAAIGMSKGSMTPEEAGKLMNSYGMGNPIGEGFKVAQRMGIALAPPEANYVSHTITKLQSILGTLVIKWDTMQQLLHAVTTPILMIPEINSVIGSLGKTNAAVKEISTLIPGTEKEVPAISKVLFSAVSDLFNPAKNGPMEEMAKRIGTLREARSEWQEIQNSLALPKEKTANAWNQYGKSIDGVLSKLSLVNTVEYHTDMLATHVGYRLFSAAGYTGRSLEDNIATFVNRVKTNITASQRPIAFGGPVGQAVGLFQSFYMNLMQNVYRYVENKDLKSLMLLGGLQSTAFGLQGMPFFHTINHHLLTAPGNTNGQDMFSTIAGLGGHGGVGNRQLGDYLLYGSISNWMNASMYTRSDISPRQLSLVPLNPADWPLVSAMKRMGENLYDIAKKISDGGSVPGNLLLGIEHNGLSRPAMGLAQLIQGFSTTGKGNLVSSNHALPGQGTTAMDDLMNGADFSRLLGSRPMDESIFLNSNYRITAFKAAQEARLEELGKAVKSKLYNGGTLTSDDTTGFMREYAKAGGNITNFNSKMMEWMKDANTSMANGISKNPTKLGNPYLITMMGGKVPQYMADFNSVPSLNGPVVLGSTPVKWGVPWSEEQK